MPNPRFVDYDGNATPELLEKICFAKEVYVGSLDAFCEKWYINKAIMENITGFYLIGSHDRIMGWNNEASDVDFKLVTPDADAEILRRFRKEVLLPQLCSSDRKKDWIDLYFVRHDSGVLEPRYDLLEDWKRY